MSAPRAVRGMNDILPEEMARWHAVEGVFRRKAALYGFSEARTPLVESTPLFVRAIGETTDVVEKEMYSFVHRDEPLTLRPEGTASLVRAFVEHSIHAREPVTRWYYVGPMFRAERPQRGRYRQFHQAGVEVFGDESAPCDAEVIRMGYDFLSEVGVQGLRVLINSIGGGETRARYTEALRAYLEGHQEKLSADSQRRTATNALRVLDSKSAADQEVLVNAPSVSEFLSEDDKAHFSSLRDCLSALGVPFEVDLRLVRGLDYYNRTLFEVKGATETLGAGDTLIGGGRYDGMVHDLGGPSVPAIGYACGLERVILASSYDGAPKTQLALVASLDSASAPEAVRVAQELRAAGLACETDCRKTSLKAKLRRANSHGRDPVLVVGGNELDRGVVQVKRLATHEQEEVPRGDLVSKVLSWATGAGRSA